MQTLGYRFRPWTERQVDRRRAVDPALHPRDRRRGRHRPAHPLRPPRRARRLVERRGALDASQVDAHRHRRGGRADLRLPVRVQRLLPLRRGLHAAASPGTRALRRPDRPPAALARGPRLRGQARRRHRQRRDGRDARPGDGRAGRARDDAAALAELHRLAPGRGPDRQRAAPRCCPTALAYPITRWKNVVLTTLHATSSAGADRGWSRRLIRAGRRRQLPEGYDVDTHFKPQLRPLGPAHVHGPRRRPLPGDPRAAARRS